MYKKSSLAALLASCTASAVANPILCTPPTSPSFAAQVATNSAKFHANFDKGDAGKKANGVLASLSIDWTVNNGHLLGNESFVQGLLGANEGFSSLQFYDMIHVNDGNMAAILYVRHGETSGPSYNGHKVAPGVKVECWNGEFMVFDQDVLLNRLITVNELDDIDLQISGQQVITSFDNIALLPTGQTSDTVRQELRATAAQFTAHFNARNVSGLKSLCSEDIAVHTFSQTTKGFSAVTDLLNQYATSFPNLLAHDECVIADGQFAAVESIVSGTHTGPFTAKNGTIVPADGKMYRTRVMRWYEFNEQGKVKNIWEVNDQNSLIENMAG